VYNGERKYQLIIVDTGTQHLPRASNIAWFKPRWQPDILSFITIDLAQGNLPSVFFLFRLLPSRTKPYILCRADPHSVVQFPIQVEILASLTRLLLAPSSPYTLNVSIASAVHFGYSYGAFITAGLASAYPELTQVCLPNLIFSL
jgi:pimeloyl-ACP methyl ester carboxylesterase